MCGAIGLVTDNYFVKQLMKELGVELYEENNNDNIRPNDKISISIEQGGHHIGVKAAWWLFQKRIDDQLFDDYTYDKRYRSFNTRKDKLFNNRLDDFKYRRCIIPASCFYEWKDARYKIEAVDSAIAFGGLYKVWPEASQTNRHYSCSIITLPPVDKLSHIHDKSFPLMLLPEEYNSWLDSSLNDPFFWKNTLDSRIRFDLKVTPVDRLNPSIVIGQSQFITREMS